MQIKSFQFECVKFSKTNLQLIVYKLIESKLMQIIDNIKLNNLYVIFKSYY